MQRRQKSKKACSSEVSNWVWQYQVKITVLLKIVAEHWREVRLHLTTGTLTHDLHEVKCFWDTGWLKPLRFSHTCAEAIPARIASPTASPLLPRQARGPDPRKHLLVLLDPPSCRIFTYWNLLNLWCSNSLDRGWR